MNKLKDLFDSLNSEEKIILYSIGALRNIPILSSTHLQKILFLVANIFPKIDELLEYKPLYLGPYSEEVENILEDLIKLDLVVMKGRVIQLSEKGKGIFKEIEPKEDLKNVIDDFKEFLVDIPIDYMLIFIYVFYPKYRDESFKWERLVKQRIDAAVYLLKKDKISFSKALEISGLNIKDFEELLMKRKVKWRYVNKNS